MIKNFLLLLLACQFHVLRAEFKPPITVGSLTMAEYQIPHSAQDSSFGAVAILKYQNRYLVKGNSPIVLRKILRYKILNEKGLFLSKLNVTDDEFLGADLVIYVHNMEAGKIITHKVEVKELQKVNNQYKGEKQFPIPNVRVGSVIDLDMTANRDISSEILFESTIPCLWHGIRMVHYPMDTIKLVYQGFDKPDEYTETKYESDVLKHDVVERVIIMKNIQANEEFDYKYNHNLVNELKYLLVNVREFKSAEFYKELFGVDLPISLEDEFIIWNRLNSYSSKDSMRLKEHLKELIKPEMNVSEKSKAIHQYVSKKYAFNGIYSKLKASSVKKIDSLKLANSADLNRMLYTLHLMAGIDAWPVFLSVRNSLRLNLTFSNLSYANHFMVRVFDTLNGPILDATVPELDYGQLPEEVYNYTSLQFNPNTLYAFILNPDSIENISTRYTEIQWTGSSLNYDCRFIPGVYETVAIHHEQKLKDSLAILNAPLLTNPDDWTLSHYSWKGVLDSTEKVECTYQMSLKKMPERLILNPVAAFIEKTPFPEKTRRTAIQFPYAMTTKDIVFLQIPPEYEIEKVPESESFRFEKDMMSFDYSIDTSTSGQIEIRMTNRVRHTFYDAAFFNDIKSYYEGLCLKREDPIILRKKKL